MKKKVLVLITGVVALGLLGACGTKKAADTKSSSSSNSTQISSTTTSTTQTKASSSAEPATSLDFTKIEAGDYSQLKGDWPAYARSDKGDPYTAYTDSAVTVTDSTLTWGELTMQKDGFVDQAGTHPVHFQEDTGHLVASIPDDHHVSINWAVTFYPIGTTTEFNLDGSTTANDQNLIAVWTSNMAHRVIFAQNPVETAAQATTTTAAGLDLQQLAANDFTSLVGTWQNAAGETMVLTGETQDRPEGNTVATTVGAIISGTERNGYPQVIGSGSIIDGYMMGSRGTFDPSFLVSTFGPLGIVPKGVQMGSGDDSDSSRDRLIVGGGQGGYQSQAYYRVE